MDHVTSPSVPSWQRWDSTHRSQRRAVNRRWNASHPESAHMRDARKRAKAQARLSAAITTTNMDH